MRGVRRGARSRIPLLSLSLQYYTSHMHNAACNTQFHHFSNLSPHQHFILVSRMMGSSDAIVVIFERRDHSCYSPSLDKLADMLKSFTVDSFGKVICPLLFCVHFQDVDLTTFNKAPEEMPVDQEILCSVVGDSLFGSKKQKGTVVVFEDTTWDGGFEMRTRQS